jgi:hypothetical protein
VKKFLVGYLFLQSAVLAAQPSPQELSAAACVPSNTTLCLSDGRFSVTADYTSAGGSGHGNGVPLTADTGYFWFFDPANIEVATKVLDACNPFNDFWVFASGLTNVGVTLNVLDTATGQLRTYNNPVNTAFEPVQDTGAFATCSTPTTHTAQVGGTWTANVQLGGSLVPVSLSMVQSGTTITGAASIFLGGGGSLAGTVSGQTLNFTVNEVSPCAGIFSGTATVAAGDGAAVGTVTGNDCNGAHTGSLDGVKTFVAGPAAPSSANVAGLWNATLHIGSTQHSTVIAFVQNGTSVTGTAVITGLGSGSLTGSVSGQSLRFTVNELGPCLGIFVATATIGADNGSATGSMTGADCAGNYQATFTATKQ